MTIVMAVDPGKTTGFAVVEWDKQSDEVRVAFSAELDFEGFAKTADECMASASQDDFYVVCESFIINAQTVRNSQAPYSLEQIGVLKYICWKSGYDPSRIAFQAPVNAKNMFPNPRLKELGTWHRGGDGHANDAIRHGLLRLVKAGWVPKILLQNT